MEDVASLQFPLSGVVSAPSAGFHASLEAFSPVTETPVITWQQEYKSTKICGIFTVSSFSNQSEIRITILQFFILNLVESIT